ncbi:hypothetical protein [Candidatus Villigracilis affinis]|uniref:hypothetical protein n=1 Tax=Candidatus Villigracilis affinis TaxID=3140682 RepID=UPI002A198A69|nr:hypothetical protein [Anaerolineales bacterium]
MTMVEFFGAATLGVVSAHGQTGNMIVVDQVVADGDLTCGAALMLAGDLDTDIGHKNLIALDDDPRRHLHKWLPRFETAIGGLVIVSMA